MSIAEKPSHTALTSDLTSASLPRVLLYGLTLDDEDPALGVLLAVRSELSLIANLAELTQPGADLDLGEIATVLESVVRRLDVALELMDRTRRAHTSGRPLAPESTPALDEERRGAGGPHDRD